MNLRGQKIKSFINDNLHNSATELMLQAHKYVEWDMKQIVQQLVGKQIAEKKLPLWHKNDDILYPIRLSMEQCSSEATAKYKSSIIKGGQGIDITGGFGIDSYFLAQKSQSITYCERDEDLAKIVDENFKTLGLNNYSVCIGDGIKHLDKIDSLDWIYIDPARRKESQRVFKLQDCEPNIIELKDRLFEKSNEILIKTAPLLDIKQTIIDLERVNAVHIVSVNNDCKEVLYHLKKGHNDEARIHCVNIKASGQEKFSFTLSKEQQTTPSYSMPLKYIYEPNSSIMKAGGFKSIATQYDIHKLHQNSHLYTANTCISDFPGRIFTLSEVLSADRKHLKKIGIEKANLACRNYPQKVDVLKKKLKIQDGGEQYLFATTLVDSKPKLLLCQKAN